MFEPSPPKARRARRVMAVLLAAGLAVGVVVVVGRDPGEAELTVRSRGTDPPPSTSTTAPPADPTTTTATAPPASTTTAPPTTTSTVPVTSTTAPAVPPTAPLSCVRSDPVADVRDGGVTVIGRDGDVRKVFDTRGMMSAVWAPDSRRLAVNWLESDGGRVAIVDVDGRVTVVSGDDRVDRPLAWTPDGRVIYVASENRPEGPWHGIRLVSPEAGEATTVWEGRATTFGVVAVAGLVDGRILFLSDEGLMVVNRDGSGLGPLSLVGLTAGDPGAPDLPRAAVRNFMLSPDGRRVATVAGGERAMIDITTGTKLAATAGSGPTVLEWSPDSRRVAFFDGIVLTDDGTARRLGNTNDVAFAGGSDVAMITWRGGGSTDDLAAEVVAADGSRRVFTLGATEVAGGAVLAAIVDSPGDLSPPRPGAVVCIAGRPRAMVVFPDADPSGLVWSPDGSRLVVVTHFIDWLR